MTKREYIEYDFERALETLLDALVNVQREHQVSDEVFLQGVEEFFGPYISDSYREWMDIEND